MRIPIVAGALALCVLLSAGPASAGVEVGEDAPDFGSDGCFNTEPISVAELSGRLILLELFSTT